MAINFNQMVENILLSDNPSSIFIENSSIEPSIEINNLSERALFSLEKMRNEMFDLYKVNGEKIILDYITMTIDLAIKNQFYKKIYDEQLAINQQKENV